jgi:hypothetical protein
MERDHKRPRCSEAAICSHFVNFIPDVFYILSELVQCAEVAKMIFSFMGPFENVHIALPVPECEIKPMKGRPNHPGMYSLDFITMDLLFKVQHVFSYVCEKFPDLYVEFLKDFIVFAWRIDWYRFREPPASQSQPISKFWLRNESQEAVHRFLGKWSVWCQISGFKYDQLQGFVLEIHEEADLHRSCLLVDLRQCVKCGKGFKLIFPQRSDSFHLILSSELRLF